MDNKIFYYVPKIPSVKSTTRYNHALAISQIHNRISLITHESVPDVIKNSFDETHELGTIQSSLDVLENARDAKNIINSGCNNSILISSFHYAQAIAGSLANCLWIVDMYDDPYQQIIHQSSPSIHQLGVRVSTRLLNRADVVIYTLHPASPRQLGKNKKYVMNGSPSSLLTNSEKPSRSPLRCIWVGKTDIRFGIRNLIKALKYSTQHIRVDVFGEPYDEAKKLSKRINHQAKIKFHGNVEHEMVLDMLEKAHVGLCLLPPTVDFKYSYPIKIGEYLAGGTVPITTGLPGIRQMCKYVGEYTSSNPKEIAYKIDKIATIPRREFNELTKSSWKRGEQISWKQERQWFKRQIFDSINEISCKRGSISI